LIAFAAVGRLDPAAEIAVILLCGGVAFSSHSAKAGARLFVNQSPEPFSNLLLSLFEDVVVVGGSYAAVAHPFAILALVTVFLGLFALLARRIYRRLRGSSPRPIPSPTPPRPPG
jgi:hypothetical protein